MSDFAEAILKHLEKYPESTVRGVVNATGLNWGAVQNTLKNLSDQGEVSRVKIGHSYHYRLGDGTDNTPAPSL